MWYQVTISPFRNDAGLLTHFFGSVKDVTALVDASKSEEARDVFLATLAHDLKSPLASAARLFALLIGGVYGMAAPELQNTLILLSNNNRKALDLVSNVLESYRLNEGVALMNFRTILKSSLREEL